MKNASYILLIVTLSIFASEALVMLLLPDLPQLSSMGEAILDASVLVCMLSPVLYFFLFQPVGTHIRERQKAEARLLNNKEEQFKAMIHGSLDGFWIVDKHGRFLEVNNAYCQLMGYSREELLKMGIMDVEAAESRAETSAHIEKVIKQGSDRFETRNLGKDGRIMCSEVSVSFSEQNGGRFYGFLRDVTEQKLLVKKLAESASEMEDLYNQAPCGYHSIGPDGTYLRINATELAWLGCEREDVVGKMKPSDFFTPQSKVLFQQSFPDFVKNGKSEDLEFDLISKKGTPRHVIVNATAIRDDDGNFVKSRSVMFDITELKKVEDKFHQLSVEQHAMLDNDLVGIVKLRGRDVVWKNKAIDRIFGYAPGELNGKSTRIFYVDDAAYQALGEAAYPVLKARGIYRTRLEMVRKNGEKIWVDLSGVQLPGQDAESLWMLADITQIQKHHEQIEQIAYHDVLTGLPNRLLLSDRLNLAMAQAERSERLLAVCYLDLDGFKPVNDNFGHDVGDLLLKEVARRMLVSVRTNDTVCRLGGDEFVLLLTSLENVEEYLAVLERVIVQINKPYVLNETNEVQVTASVGVTLFPFDSNDPDTLLRHADQAMYRAKNLGRDRVCLYSPEYPDTTDFYEKAVLKMKPDRKSRVKSS